MRGVRSERRRESKDVSIEGMLKALMKMKNMKHSRLDNMVVVFLKKREYIMVKCLRNYTVYQKEFVPEECRVGPINKRNENRSKFLRCRGTNLLNILKKMCCTIDREEACRKFSWVMKSMVLKK